MADIHVELARLLEDFTGKVAALAQRSVVETARAAFQTSATSSARNGRTVAAPAPSREPAAAGARLVSHLLASPGQRMDELVATFGTPAPALRSSIQQLVAQGLVRFEGNTRGRRYYATNGATSATSSKARKGRRRRS
jgi:hypothetical protein